MPKVSVVIPVYNVEPYIERCLHTLFSQTFDNIEYIFVNDGSTDRSSNIITEVLKQYPHRNSQVKILQHECNKGTAAARTTGILAASGEYIIHCDPDDYLETDMYELMYNTVEKTRADIVVCDHICEKNGQVYIKKTYLEDSPVECLRYWYNKRADYSMLWDKLVRRSLIIQNCIIPYIGIDSGEDFGCMVRILYHARSIVHVPKALYHYVRRNNSISKQAMTRTTFDSRLRLAQKICTFLKDKGFDDFCNNMKFDIKLSGRHLFNDKESEWFNIFPECHKHIMFYEDNSFKSRLLWWLALRNIVTYKLLKKYVPALK